MSQETIAARWNEARRHEIAGEAGAAMGLYASIVASDRTQGAAWLRIAALSQADDDYTAARAAALEAATAIKARCEWKLLPYVTQRLLGFDERTVVADAIASADWSHPDVLAQSAVLSQHLWLVEEFHLALRLIEHAMPLVKPSHLLHYSRANALRFCGCMDEATKEYEQAIAMAPDYAFAHWSLAYHRRADPPSARVDRVRQAIAHNPAGTPEHTHLQYALFKELDANGRVAEAWAALAEGADRMRRSLRHDAASERRGCVALIDATRDPPSSKVASERVDAHVPVFIVGMPRTGTTVVERILGNHDAVASGGELNAFHAALCEASGGFVGQALDERTVARLATVDLADVGHRYLARTRHLAAGRTHLVDKNPMNVFNAGYIAHALPDAKIVCLHRNPMDACFSNLKELFSGDAYAYSYDLAELAAHYARFRLLCEHWQRTLGDRFMMVDYEGLVTRPAHVAQRIMAFCGASFDATSIDLPRNRSPVSTASSSQVREPISTSGIGAWRRYGTQLLPLRSALQEMLGIECVEELRAPVTR